MIVALLSSGVFVESLSFAAVKPTAKQIAELRKIDQALTSAGKLYQQKKFTQSASSLANVEASLKQLSTSRDRQLQQLLQQQIQRFNRARGLLRQQGVEIPKASTTTRPPTPPAADPNGPISFVSIVAPTLVSKCGRCHINKSSGDFSMSNFQSLMKGSSSGIVLVANDSKGSRIMELVESGEMPPGNAKLAENEVVALRKWIDEGAKFDGPDSSASLTELAAASSPSTPQRNLEVEMATGNESISFARDIAPLLTSNCNGCHFNSTNVQGGLRFDTFRQLLRGGDSGPEIVPGNSKNSPLATRLKGDPKERMPRRRPALPDEAIAKIEKWIDEGAKFDGKDPNLNLQRVADIAIASAASHDELLKQRQVQAEKKLGVGNAGN